MKPSKIRNRTIHKADNRTRSKMMGSHLSTELQESYGRRSMRVIPGDYVVVKRGVYRTVSGKVEKVVPGKGVVVAGTKKEKVGGESYEVYIHPTNMLITSLKTDDKRRPGIGKVAAAKGVTDKTKGTADDLVTDKETTDEVVPTMVPPPKMWTGRAVLPRRRRNVQPTEEVTEKSTIDDIVTDKDDTNDDINDDINDEVVIEMDTIDDVDDVVADNDDINDDINEGADDEVVIEMDTIDGAVTDKDDTNDDISEGADDEVVIEMDTIDGAVTDKDDTNDDINKDDINKDDINKGAE